MGNFESNCLVCTFILETSSPTVETCRAIFKDKVVPLFPNLPCCNYENFHEKIIVVTLLCRLCHLTHLNMGNHPKQTTVCMHSIPPRGRVQFCSPCLQSCPLFFKSEKFHEALCRREEQNALLLCAEKKL